MKVIFYKWLIANGGKLTPTEKILYSNIVRSAINRAEGVYDENGDYVGYALDDYKELELPTFSQNSFAKKTKIVTQAALSIAHKGLIEKGYINSFLGTITINSIYKHGYFELLIDSGLKGEILIFYSWLKELSDGNKIFANIKRLAELYCCTTIAIKDYLFRLRKKHLVERDSNGNLIIK